MVHLPVSIRLPDSTLLEWMTRLNEATTPVQIAATVARLARDQTGCRRATLLWSGSDPEKFEGPSGAPDAEDLRHARALLDGAEAFTRHGSVLALRLERQRAVLLLQLDDDSLPLRLIEAIEPCLDLAARHLRRALKLVSVYQSHRQLQRSEALQRALFAISDLAGSDRDMPELLRGIHAIVSTLMYAENFFIVRYDAERDSLRFLYYADVEDTAAPGTQDIAMSSRVHTLTWHLITGGKPLMGSAEQLQEQINGPVILSGPDSIDWLGVPMARDGIVRGALVVQSYKEGGRFTDEDRALLEFVGNHILTALERKQGKDELEQRVRLRTLELAAANLGLQQEVLERQRAEKLQAALFHIAQLATADIDEGKFYQSVHSVVGELLPAENFFIALISADLHALEFPYYVDSGSLRIVSRELGRGLSEYVMRIGRPLLGGAAQIDDLARRGEIDLQRIGRPAVCWLGVPLRVDDQVIGLVVVQSYTEKVTYAAPDQELLSFAALQIANSIHRRRSAVSLQRAYGELEQRVEERTRELREQIMQRERVQSQLKHQVMHDPLTGLANRRFLRERLERVLKLLREPGRRCALLYLDIDRFKVVNDSLGHPAGDALLREVARRLLDCVRHPDMVARLSGDEFAILLEELETPGAAQIVAQRVLDTVGMTLQVAGRELRPSVSIGIAIGDSTYAAADEIVRDADRALYRAKELGRNRFELFDEALARNAVDVLTMESELRHALQFDEFEPHFQPICRLDSGCVVGYEALLRWNHPLDGMIGPSAFLKVAQDGGHIEAIDWRLFELGCRAVSDLPDPDIFLTINVSALHLRHADFDTRLTRLLESAGLSTRRLIVEVTEGALLDDAERVRETLERLRTLGIGSALDDFGTGYSSLSYLHSLPLRMLKIDRSFVQALDAGLTTTATVVTAILALARALNIQVVAEGIETPAQRASLLQMGCEFGQGYLLGRPAALRR